MSSGAEQPPTPFEELHSSGSIFDSHKYQALSAHADANADADPCTTIVREFLVSGDVEDLKLTLSEKADVISRSRLVKKAVILAMEYNAYERELTSKLFADLSLNTISKQEFAEAFLDLVGTVDDTAVDIPEASIMIGKFLARAICDEVLPPSFLDHAASFSSKRSNEAFELARNLIQAPFFGVSLEHIWGPGDLQSRKRLVREFAMLVEEFAIHGDQNEIAQSIRKLNVFSFNYLFAEELIKVAIVNDKQREKLVQLLVFLHKQFVLPKSHIEKAFSFFRENFEDISIDMPLAKTQFQPLQEQAFAALGF